MKILYLVPDTNLFFQCRPLAELAWSDLGSFDEIRLIVVRPVHKEVDYRKGNGNDRVNARARSTNAMFKKVLQAPEASLIVRDSSPRVSLTIEVGLRPDPELAHELDYQERDEQLIGTISTFKKRNPAFDVRLLTHDGTPLATARALGLGALEIDESWLLAPESSESDKRIKHLETEISRLRAAEPQFELTCVGADGVPVERLEYILSDFQALSAEELNALMQRIVDRFPEETSFPSEESVEKPPYSQFLKYVPATTEQIARYHDHDYPAWLEKCRALLKTYHLTLNVLAHAQAFCIVASNRGTRPAEDALVRLEAKGNFSIQPPPYKSAASEPPPPLPTPPSAPSGKWESMVLNQAVSALLGDSKITLEDFANIPHNLGSIENFVLPRPQRQDDNAFYYTPERPGTPQDAFSLVCRQWRHGKENEHEFRGTIHYDLDEPKVAGLLTMRIEAANLSDPVEMRVPVRISIVKGSAFEHALALVRQFVGETA